MSRTNSRKRKNQYGLKRDKRGIWHCDFSVAGKRIQRSCFTDDKAQAEEFCASLAGGAWREKKLGERPQITWPEAAALWVRTKQEEGKRDLPNDVLRLKVLAEFMPSAPLSVVTALELDAALDHVAETRGIAGATRNRYRALITGAFNIAREKGYDVAAVKPTRAKDSDDRVRWLTKEEAAKLIGELPLHVKRMAIFSLMTGVRQANCTGLLWRNVDMERRIAWVWAEDAKGKRAISIPLNDAAMAVLREAKTCPHHRHASVVFTYYGEPIEDPASTAWRNALERAGIDDFTWHDWRHCWASWHVMGWMSAQGISTPLPVLQKLGGWADIRMVLKYAHLAPDYTAQYAGDSPALTGLADLTQQPEQPRPTAGSVVELVEAQQQRRVA